MSGKTVIIALVVGAAILAAVGYGAARAAKGFAESIKPPVPDYGD